MANFDLAIVKTLQNEGGYTNDPNDAGGATKYGITLKVLQGRGSWGDFDGDGVITSKDIQLMTEDQAKKIYKELYWIGDPITSQAIAEKHFDIGVNMGVKTASKLLQQACNICGASLAVDGDIGKHSLESINSIDEVSLMTALCNMQNAKYWSIVENDIKNNAVMLYKWPPELAAEAQSCCYSRDLDRVKEVIKALKSLKVKLGNISFIGGWSKRAAQRFGV